MKTETALAATDAALRRAKLAIDELFGEGHAKRYPGVVMHYLAAAARFAHAGALRALAESNARCGCDTGAENHET
jgi:hypothetical protein